MKYSNRFDYKAILYIRDPTNKKRLKHTLSIIRHE